jgi:sugar phosphate isomerase/epimerase
MSIDKPIKRRQFISTMAAAGVALPLSSLSYGHLQNPSPEHKPVICVFSKHLQFLPNYQTMAEVAAEIGFDGVELTVRPGGHVLPENVEMDLPKAVEAIKKSGLKYPMMVTKITDPDNPITETILRTASELGIKYYRMGYLRFDEKMGVTKSLENLKTKFARLAALNKEYNIVGTYQNHSGDRVGGPVWDLWDLLKDLDPKWIGCQYDIRHATVEGAYSWPLGMDLLTSYIKTTAIKDFYWKKDVPWAPGWLILKSTSHFTRKNIYRVPFPCISSMNTLINQILL